jgi:hypothetical protein
MPKKKQSARPAESGWLLEIGAIGINKSLQLLKKGFPMFDLMQVEALFRNYSSVKRRGSLPYLNHPAIPVCEAFGVEVVSDDQGAPREIILPGRLDEYDELMGLIYRDEEKKKGKGSGPSGSSRASLDRWVLDDETSGLILEGPCGDSDKGTKLKTIKAHSRALADVIDVISGRKKSLPQSYPEEIEKRIRGKARANLLEILRISLLIPEARLEHLSRNVERAKQKLVMHDFARRELELEVFMAELSLKKWEERIPTKP